MLILIYSRDHKEEMKTYELVAKRNQQSKLNFAKISKRPFAHSEFWNEMLDVDVETELPMLVAVQRGGLHKQVISEQAHTQCSQMK
jgi:hypothetical protein